MQHGEKGQHHPPNGLIRTLGAQDVAASGVDAGDDGEEGRDRHEDQGHEHQPLKLAAVAVRLTVHAPMHGDLSPGGHLPPRPPR